MNDSKKPMTKPAAPASSASSDRQQRAGALAELPAHAILDLAAGGGGDPGVCGRVRAPAHGRGDEGADRRQPPDDPQRQHRGAAGLGGDGEVAGGGGVGRCPGGRSGGRDRAAGRTAGDLQSRAAGRPSACPASDAAAAGAGTLRLQRVRGARSELCRGRRRARGGHRDEITARLRGTAAAVPRGRDHCHAAVPERGDAPG